MWSVVDNCEGVVCILACGSRMVFAGLLVDIWCKSTLHDIIEDGDPVL